MYFSVFLDFLGMSYIEVFHPFCQVRLLVGVLKSVGSGEITTSDGKDALHLHGLRFI